MLSHSPLKIFSQLHDKCVLVSGQGPILEVANKYPLSFYHMVMFVWLFTIMSIRSLQIRAYNHLLGMLKSLFLAISNHLIYYVCELHFSKHCFCLFSLNWNIISLGFQNVLTIDMLRESYPLLDVVDHNRRPKNSVSVPRKGLTFTWISRDILSVYIALSIICV